MTRWEYQMVSLVVDKGMFGTKLFDASALTSELNRLGKQGWELVAVVDLSSNGWSNQLLATLKRPIIDQ